MKSSSIQYGILCLIILSFLFSACSKDSNPAESQKTYSEMAQGKWVNTMINDKPVQTDSSFIMELRSDNIEMYATGTKLDENNISWIEGTGYIYSVTGDVITIKGTNITGSSVNMNLKILSLDESTLRYSVSSFSIGGVSYPDSKIYTCKKTSEDCSTKFTGIWYGKSTSGNTGDVNCHYWEYFNDGTYNYYYQDGSGNWIKKSDNEGRYFLYGGFFVSNYSNDLVSGGTGKAYECWNFTIKSDTMTCQVSYL